jgi:acetyl esterase/lipase
MDLKNYKFFHIWPDNALPYAETTQPQDIPTLQVVLPTPEKANGFSVIIFPGGGYTQLAPHEGVTVGEWLAEAGFTAFVLAYRRGPDNPYPVPLLDGYRAVRFIRHHASEWGLNPQGIGVLGFSAGGHLASTLATHFVEAEQALTDPVGQESARLDFQILIYPVISMGGVGHERSRLNLLGSKPDESLVELLSNEKHVTAETPPTFIFHSTGDKSVKVANSDRFAARLEEAGVPYKYIRGDFGKHGIGVHPCWSGECLEWLQSLPIRVNK